jgi:hypothetical protein
LAKIVRHPTPPERLQLASQHQVDLAQKHGISIEQVEDLMHQYGHDRTILDAAARRLPD